MPPKAAVPKPKWLSLGGWSRLGATGRQWAMLSSSRGGTRQHENHHTLVHAAAHGPLFVLTPKPWPGLALSSGSPRRSCTARGASPGRPFPRPVPAFALPRRSAVPRWSARRRPAVAALLGPWPFNLNNLDWHHGCNQARRAVQDASAGCARSGGEPFRHLMPAPEPIRTLSDALCHRVAVSLAWIALSWACKKDQRLAPGRALLRRETLRRSSGGGYARHRRQTRQTRFPFTWSLRRLRIDLGRSWRRDGKVSLIILPLRKTIKSAPGIIGKSKRSHCLLSMAFWTRPVEAPDRNV